jgi:diguanylate cyclase (GGDEF)-like protein
MKAIKSEALRIPDALNVKGVNPLLNISASVGIAIYNPKSHPDLAAWVKEADQALYQAKHRGRARLVCQQPEFKEWI